MIQIGPFLIMHKNELVMQRRYALGTLINRLFRLDTKLRLWDCWAPDGTIALDHMEDNKSETANDWWLDMRLHR